MWLSSAEAPTTTFIQQKGSCCKPEILRGRCREVCSGTAGAGLQVSVWKCFTVTEDLAIHNSLFWLAEAKFGTTWTEKCFSLIKNKILKARRNKVIFHLSKSHSVINHSEQSLLFEARPSLERLQVSTLIRLYCVLLSMELTEKETITFLSILSCFHPPESWRSTSLLCDNVCCRGGEQFQSQSWYNFGAFVASHTVVLKGWTWEENVMIGFYVSVAESLCSVCDEHAYIFH